MKKNLTRFYCYKYCIYQTNYWDYVSLRQIPYNDDFQLVKSEIILGYFKTIGNNCKKISQKFILIFLRGN